MPEHIPGQLNFLGVKHQYFFKHSSDSRVQLRLRTIDLEDKVMKDKVLENLAAFSPKIFFQPPAPESSLLLIFLGSTPGY